MLESSIFYQKFQDQHQRQHQHHLNNLKEMKEKSNVKNDCVDLVAELLLAYSMSVAKLNLNVCKLFAFYTKSIYHILNDPECSVYYDAFMHNESCLYLKTPVFIYHLYKYKEYSVYKEFADKLDIYSLEEFTLSEEKVTVDNCPFANITITTLDLVAKSETKGKTLSDAIIFLDSYFKMCIDGIYKTYLDHEQDKSVYNDESVNLGIDENLEHHSL